MSYPFSSLFLLLPGISVVAWYVTARAISGRKAIAPVNTTQTRLYCMEKIMMTGLSRIGVLAILGVATVSALYAQDGAPLVTPQTATSVSENASVNQDAGTWTISVTKGGAAALTFAQPNGYWDLSRREKVEIELENLSTRPLEVWARLDDATAKNYMDSCRSAVVVEPKRTQTLTVYVVRRPEDPGYAKYKPFLMYTKDLSVRYGTIDPAAVTGLSIWIADAQQDDSLRVRSIRPIGDIAPYTPKFEPFCDQFGQYRHADWPGKIHSVEDLAARKAEEDREMAAHAQPADWDEYGGWGTGPTLSATGFFYVTQHEGKWWLVDPKGKLFFSYGPTGVGSGGDTTPITDRESWFEKLPDRNSEFGKYYSGKQHGATYCYYQNRDWEGFDFGAANLLRKYGPDYENIVASRMHDRLHNWGLNTIANWSSDKVYLMHRTPYVVAIHYGSPKLYRMPDVFDPKFREALAGRMASEVNKTAGDPWNIGYFVDNELWWGYGERGYMVAENVLKEPATLAAKKEFAKDLQAKYGEIARLNEAWGTQHASWDAFLEAKGGPDPKKSKAVMQDYGDFALKFADRYFAICREEVKRVAPNNLYLGCRFHGHIDTPVIEVAAKYCDAIGYNVYDKRPGDRLSRFAKTINKPFIVGEFGLGADPTQTPWRGNKDENPDPAERSRALITYAENAFTLPNLVGIHFFQFRDQPVTGRPDGEAVLRGFLNIADTPHFDLVQTSRKLGGEMYSMRSAH